VSTQTEVVAFGRFALGSRDSAATVGRAVDVLTTALSAPMGVVVRLLTRPDRVALVHSRGGFGPAPGAEFHLDEGLLATAGTDEPLIAQDWTTTRSAPWSAGREAGVRAGISVSLPVGGRPWGRLAVLYDRPRRFEAAELDFIQAIAHLLAAALERDRAEQAQALVAEFGRFALQSRDITTTTERAVEVVSQAVAAPMCAVVQLLGPGMAAMVASRGPVSLTSGEQCEVDPALLAAQAASGPTDLGYWRPEPRRAHHPPGADDTHVSLSVMVPLEGLPWGRIVVSDIGPRVIDGAEVGVLRSVANVLAAALERERIETGHAAVSSFGRFALQSRDIASAIERAVDVVTRVLDAPMGCVVRLAGRPDRLVVVHVGGPVGMAPGEEYDVGPDLAAAYATTEPLIIDDWRTESRFLPPRIAQTAQSVASVSVTVLVQGREWGRLMVSDVRPRRFSGLEVDVIQSLAHVLAAALERDQTEARMRQTARDLQRALLPTTLPTVFPAVAGVEAAGRYTVSGDRGGAAWYDLLPLPHGGVGLVIGQVEGHGVAAATVLAGVREVFGGLAADGLGPAAIMNRVDGFVAAHADRLISCCYAELRPAELSLTGVSAGHPLPVVLSPDGFLRPVPLSSQRALGGEDRAHYTEQCILLPAGSTVLLATEGLVDDLPIAIHPGPDGVAGVVRDQAEQPVEDLADSLISHPVSATAGREDAALLAVRLTPGAGEGQVADHETETVYRMFGPTPQTAPAARRFVLDVLLGWGMTDLEHTAALAVSELVTNVVVHTSSPVHLTLRRIGESGVWIGVRDDSDRLPQPRDFAVDEIAGRGLVIVEQLADTWGVQRPLDHSGKTVWLELTSSGDPAHICAPEAIRLTSAQIPG